MKGDEIGEKQQDSAAYIVGGELVLGRWRDGGIRNLV